MKKIFCFLFVLLFTTMALFSVVPIFYGARSLSLGYSSLAYNYDINAIFINPALLSNLRYSISGYQYQHSYFDYKNFIDELNEILDYDLKNYFSLDSEKKEILFAKLNDLFNSKYGLFGMKASIPGFVAKDYGFSVSFVDTAIINPQNSDIFSKQSDEISNSDIASLDMNFIGLSYTQFSLSYSLNVSTEINFGISFHYMVGKIAEFKTSIVDEVFTSDANVKHYLAYGWDNAETKFYKLNVDLSLIADVGKYFKIGIVVKNVGSPKLVTPQRDIVMERRIIAGLAFRPDLQWGIYLDIDVNKTDILFNGEKSQLFSMGIEKGFFKNKLMLRAGFLNDLTEKYIIGNRSNILYGLGFGFNMKKIIVDLAVGIDSNGNVNNLAVSGFFLL